ncbi:MAG: hypothetical protein ABIB04_03125 [Patescibacteria group bacterium]
MATLKDVYDLSAHFLTSIKLYGATTEFTKKLHGLIRAVGDAVMEEQGLDDPELAHKLSKETVLGQKALSALEEMRALLIDIHDPRR